MKKTNVLLAVLCGMLCMGLVTCASSGGGASGGSTGEAYAGTWEWTAWSDEGDGGNSTIEFPEGQLASQENSDGTTQYLLKGVEEVIDGQTVMTYTFTGFVNDGFEWGSCSWQLTPDDATLDMLKKATAISFKAIGDGNNYLIQIPIPSVTDYGFHRRTIATKAGEMVEFNFPTRTFLQPSWAAPKRFNLGDATAIIFNTFDANQGAGVGPFSIKIWDFKLIL